MEAREMVIINLESKLTSLDRAGYAMAHDLVITPDEIVAEHTPEDEFEETGEQYARSLVIDVSGTDEGLQLTFTLGGPSIAAQHIADFNQWYMLGRSSTFRRTKALDADEDADAIRALDYLLDLHKATMPAIG